MAALVSSRGVMVALLIGVATLCVVPASAQQRDCNRPLRDPVMLFDVPGGEPAPTRDGCWIFTIFVDNTETPTGSGIAILRRTESGIEIHGSVPLPSPRLGPDAPPAIGIALTHDDKLLVVSHNTRLTFLDTAKMIAGTGNPVLGEIESPRLSRSWGVVVSDDDKYALAAQQGTAAVLVIDLDKIRGGVIDPSALVGLIPTPPAATTSALSRDGRYLYTTALRPPDVLEPALKCQGGKVAEGAVQVADVQRARTDPASATVAFASPAGCNPFFATLSPDGRRLSVAAGGPPVPPTQLATESALVVFDTTPVRDGKSPAEIGRVPMPQQATRVADSGDRLFVGFQVTPGNQPKSANLMVLDPARVGEGKAAILGTLPFPAMSLTVSADRRTLYVARFGWTKLVVVDLQRLTLEPAAN